MILKQGVPISTMLWIFWKTRLAIFFQLLLSIRLPVCPCRARSWAWLCAVLGRHSWEIVGCKLVPVFLCASCDVSGHGTGIPVLNFCGFCFVDLQLQ